MTAELTGHEILRVKLYNWEERTDIGIDQNLELGSIFRSRGRPIYLLKANRYRYIGIGILDIGIGIIGIGDEK